MPIIKNTENKYWWECGTKGTLIHCWEECKLAQLLWEAVWRLLKKLKIELLYGPAILCLGIYLKDYENRTAKRQVHSLFTVSLLTMVKKCKQPVAINRQMNKMWCIYTHTIEYYPAIKKKEVLPFAIIHLNLEGYAKWNKPER